LAQGLTALKDADGLTGEEARGTFEKALEIFKDLVEDYGATRNGELGLFFAGKCLSRLERYQEAIPYYQEFLSTHRTDALYASLALQGLGFAYENGKDYEKALAYFGELADMEGSFLRGRSILAMARIHEDMGHKAEALEAYRRFVTEYPDSPESNRIQGRIALLERQSP
jgi:tetratricopeptide (TPR) repeat protein